MMDWSLAAGIIAALSGASVGAVAWVRAKPEARKLGQEGAAVYLNSVTASATATNKRVDELYEEVEDLRAKDRARDKMDLVRDQLAWEHSRWDRQVVDIVRTLDPSIPEPPPLFPVTP
jgi:hypothetical protein